MTLEVGSRRRFLISALALVTAPAIVRADSIMKIAAVDLYDTRCIWTYDIGTDLMVMRVDRADWVLPRPWRERAMNHVHEVPLAVAKKIMPPQAFMMQPPPGVQRYTSMPIITRDFARAGWNVDV